MTERPLTTPLTVTVTTQATLPVKWYGPWKFPHYGPLRHLRKA